MSGEVPVCRATKIKNSFKLRIATLKSHAHIERPFESHEKKENSIIRTEIRDPKEDIQD